MAKRAGKGNAIFPFRRCQIQPILVYWVSVRPIPYFDLKDHLRFLHRQVLPLFFFLLSLVLIFVVIYQSGRSGGDLPEADYLGAPHGLLRPAAEPVFDAAFATLSPIELALAPEAPVFSPFRPPQGPEREVRSLALGRVVLANERELILAHQRQGEVVLSVFRGLSSVRVGVGRLVPREEVIGIAGEDFAFSWQHFPALTGGPAVAGRGDNVPEAWWGRPRNRLAPPPQGADPEERVLKLDNAQAP